MLLILFWQGAFLDHVHAQETQNTRGLAREHYYQGVFYGKQSKYTEAILELEKAIELYPAYEIGRASCRERV